MVDELPITAVTSVKGNINPIKSGEIDVPLFIEAEVSVICILPVWRLDADILLEESRKLVNNIKRINDFRIRKCFIL